MAAQTQPIDAFGRTAWSATTALHNLTADAHTVEAQLRGHNVRNALDVAREAAKHATTLVAALEAMSIVSTTLDLTDSEVANTARERLTAAFND